MYNPSEPETSNGKASCENSQRELTEDSQLLCDNSAGDQEHTADSDPYHVDSPGNASLKTHYDIQDDADRAAFLAEGGDDVQDGVSNPMTVESEDSTSPDSYSSHFLPPLQEPRSQLPHDAETAPHPVIPENADGTPKTFEWPAPAPPKKIRLQRLSALKGTLLMKEMISREKDSHGKMDGGKHKKPRKSLFGLSTKILKKTSKPAPIMHADENHGSSDTRPTPGDCAKGSDEDKKDLLFKMTLDYLHNISEDDMVCSVIRSQFLGIETPEGFVRTIYEASRSSGPIDMIFWKAAKEITVGSSHSIDLGVTSGKITRHSLTPVQFGGSKGGVRPYISSYHQDLGAYGENWVFTQLIKDRNSIIRPGKICKLSFPLSSTTPDYLFHTGEDDCPATAPIYFEKGAVVGVGETKTSLMSFDTVPVWMKPDVTVLEILENNKPKMIKNVFATCKTRRPPLPSWLLEKARLGDELMQEIQNTTKWFLQYYEDINDQSSNRIDREFNMTVPENRVYVKCLTSTVGRQMLCEALSVLDYVTKDTVKVCGFFPSAKDFGNIPRDTFRTEQPDTEEEKETPKEDFRVMYNLCCCFDLSVDLLREFDALVNDNLAHAMYSVAKNCFLL